MPKSKIEVKSSFLKDPSSYKNNESHKISNKKSKAPFVSSTIVIFLFFISLGALYFLGIFNIHNYYVSGNTITKSEDIIASLKTKTDNKFILTVDPTSLEKQILNSFPLLSYARVTKTLPYTLNIEVKERSQALVLKTLENTVLVSLDGTVVQDLKDENITGTTYKNLYVVKLIDETKKDVGYKFTSSFISDLTQLLDNWNKDKSPQYTDVLVDKEFNIKIILTNQGTITLSLNDPNVDIEKLVTNTTEVYNRLSAQNKIKTMDMRFDKIAVTYYK